MPKQDKKIAQARDAFLAGDYRSGLEVFEKEAIAGNKQAAIGLMYIFGYLNKWEELVDVAMVALRAEKESYYAANVFDEAVLLVATAGQKTGQWKTIITKLKNNLKGIDYGPRLKLVLSELDKYLKAEGKMSKKVFPVVEVGIDLKTPAEKAKCYQDVLTNVFKIKPKLKDPSKKADLQYYLFNMASIYDQYDEMIKYYLPKNKLFGYQQALDMAKIYAKNGEVEKAWETFSAKIGDWYPVDEVQLMPVEPLVDDDLSKMMDSKRALFLLESPKCGGN